MHSPNSEIFSKSQPKTSSSKTLHRCVITGTPTIWINQLTRSWTIRQKIACGYVLSISIAILGTGAGLLVGEHSDDQAARKLNISLERAELMANLDQAVFEVDFYQRHLGYSNGFSGHQDADITEFIASIKETKKFLYQLKVNLNNAHDIPQDYKDKLQTFLHTYNFELNLLLKQIDNNQSSFDKVQAIKRTVGMTRNEDNTPQFQKFSANLDKLVKSTLEQKQQARTTFKNAKVLRLIIILVSMGLSIVIATILAFYTSHVIARPIRAVTKVAQRAAQEGNYDLKAPIINEDEIGVLAASINQLIEKVSTQIRELKQAQTRLIQTEKMSGLGQMVAGIAHEINNPINFIYGNIDYANDYIKDLLELLELYQLYYPEPASEITNKIENIELEFLSEDLIKILSSMYTGAERIQQIIISLRSFCHLDEAEKKRVDINVGIDNTLLILSNRVNQGIEIIKQYEDLPLVECYPAQLNQAFMHILSNAIDELLAYRKLSEPQIFIQTKLVKDNQIEVRIRDNGLGIDQKIKDKIFDPFFTTKAVGQGTGMGLAICYQVVEKHGGTIEVFSKLNQGAEFVITLPVSKS